MFVIALGFFDGVHIGHAALLKQTASAASRLGLESRALTFDVSPKQFAQGACEPLINTAADREYLLKQYVDGVMTLRFGERLMRTPPREFLHAYIKPAAAHVVAGTDFRFGYKGEGTAALLTQECQRLGIGCDIVPQVVLDGAPVSSTLTRRLIAGGDMESAARFLGRPHILSGEVKHGRKLGSTIGFPTVNIAIPEQVVIPAYGVYLTRVFARGTLYPSVTNVGVRPTVLTGASPNAETTLFGFSGDLYGENIRVEFLKFMRGEMKFASVEELKQRIAKDVERAMIYHEQR